MRPRLLRAIKEAEVCCAAAVKEVETCHAAAIMEAEAHWEIHAYTLENPTRKAC